MPAQRLEGVDLVYAGSFCVIWSSAFVATKIAFVDCPPLILLMGRFVIAAIILFAIARARGPFPRLSKRDYAALAAIGLTMHAIHLSFGYSGVNLTSAGFAAIVFSTGPILVAIVAAFTLGERLSRTKIIGLALGFVGVVIIFRSRIGGGIDDPLGAVFLLIAASALVAGTIIYKKLMPAGGLWYGQAIQFTVAGITVLPAALMLNDIGDVNLTTNLLLAFGYIVVFTSIGAYSLWLYLVSRTSASAASSLLFLTPPLGLFAGWLLLSEPVAIADLVGVVPIAIGIRMVTRG